MAPDKVVVLVITAVIAVLLALTLMASPERAASPSPALFQDPLPKAAPRATFNHAELRRGAAKTKIERKESTQESTSGEGVTWTRHRIERGETLGGLAQRYYGASRFASVLQAANPRLDPKVMLPGTELVIPKMRPALSASAPAPSHDASRRWHELQEGETLGSIAKRYYGKSADWTRIFEANRGKIKSPHRVREGTRLLIP